MTGKYEAVIGLEVHAQLVTRTKAFCACPAEYGGHPNSNTCPVCLGHPGALPVLNGAVVRNAVLMGLATSCRIRHYSTFSRKNYFYADLPKGYQISQFEDPICYEGSVTIELDGQEPKSISITRIHMEEDSGKSIHDVDVDTLVDLSRSGVPLIEIVSGPDIRSAKEAYAYLHQIRQALMYLGISSGNLEEGSLRCDANVSVRPIGQEKFGTKAEVKNLNSFRNVERAIEFEIQRQIAVLEAGGTISQETRLWDASLHETRPMRSKEFAHDYRYFPEPDLVAVHLDDAWVESIARTMPELPWQRKKRLIADYGLPSYDAGILVEDKGVADYFLLVCEPWPITQKERFKLASNWIMTEVLRILSSRKISISEFPVPATYLTELIDLISAETISSKTAKDVFAAMLESNLAPQILVERMGLLQISDIEAILPMVTRVLESNPENVEKYKAGKTNLFGFFVSQVLKESGGRANPKIVTDLLRRQLS